jgi:hypothetical protein
MEEMTAVTANARGNRSANLARRATDVRLGPENERDCLARFDAATACSRRADARDPCHCAACGRRQHRSESAPM